MFDQLQPHQHLINTSIWSKKVVLHILNLIFLCISEETFMYWKFIDKTFSLLYTPNENNCCATVLDKFLPALSVFWVNGVFKCNKLAANFKLTLGMIFVVLYKYLNCAFNKTIDTGHATSTDYNTNYRMKVLRAK